MRNSCCATVHLCECLGSVTVSIWRCGKNASLVCPMAAVLPLGHLVKFKKKNIVGGDILEMNKKEAFTGRQPLYFAAAAAYALCLLADNSAECQISTFGPLFPVFTSPVQ